MRKTTLLAISLGFLGCMPPLKDGPPADGTGATPGGNTTGGGTTGGGTTGGGGGNGNTGGGNMGGGMMGGGGVSGTLTGTQSWTGMVTVSGPVVVDTGATLDIAAGALVQFAASASVTVKGTLTSSGTAASGVTLQPMQMGSNWGGILIGQGGTATISYTSFDSVNVAVSCGATSVHCAGDHLTVKSYTGSAITSSGPDAQFSYLTVMGGSGDGVAQSGGNLTVTDSIFNSSNGADSINVSSGNLTFQYNKVLGNYVAGGAAATPDIHCASHLTGTGTFLVDHNDFNGSSYGFMVSGLNATSKVTMNNYVNNMALVSVLGAVDPGADLSGNWWGGAAPPTIQGNTTDTNAAAALIAPTGPR